MATMEAAEIHRLLDAADDRAARQAESHLRLLHGFGFSRRLRWVPDVISHGDADLDRQPCGDGFRIYPQPRPLKFLRCFQKDRRENVSGHASDLARWQMQAARSHQLFDRLAEIIADIT